MSVYCAVVGCSNGSYKLEKWKSQMCPLHNCHQGCNHCTCDPPLRLFSFPSAKCNKNGRDRWRKALNRADPKKTWSLIEPSKYMRVCSVHFVDGEPTDANPDPTLKLGYDVPYTKTKARRTIKKTALTDETTSETTFEFQTATTSSATCDMEICAPTICDSLCTDELWPAGIHVTTALLTVLILILVKQLMHAGEEVLKLAKQLDDLNLKQREVLKRKRCSHSVSSVRDLLKLTKTFCFILV